MLHPILYKRFRTNAHYLCYHCLASPVSSDTMFTSTVSIKGNTCAQVNVIDFGWVKVHLMTSSSEAHENNDVFYHWSSAVVFRETVNSLDIRFLELSLWP